MHVKSSYPESRYVLSTTSVMITCSPQLDLRDDGEDIQAALGEITGARSVPRVFVGGKFIGEDVSLSLSARELGLSIRSLSQASYSASML
jgi:glutaredoxin-related protein